MTGESLRASAAVYVCVCEWVSVSVYVCGCVSVQRRFLTRDCVRTVCVRASLPPIELL